MTTRAFIIGHPIGHSRSPLIHAHWLKAHGVAGAFERIDVAPEDLQAFLAGFEAQGYVGGSVTIPHKETVFAALAHASPAARAMGAVNAIWREAGELHGDNTDIVGFLANLDERAPGWDGHGHAVVLGAGGAARAIVHALLSRRFERVALVNRSRDRAEALATLFGGRIRTAGWDDRAATLGGAGLLVNTTSLGMEGQPPLDLDLSGLPASALVNDIVYVPLETRFLAAARERGLQTVDGLGMLLHQAVPGFERWFGVRPRVTDDLRALIEADLQRPK